MKKLIYSNITKFVAVVLCILSVTAGALVVIDGIAWLKEEEDFVYQFEENFEKSGFFIDMLEQPEYVLYAAYSTMYQGIWENEERAELMSKQTEHLTLEGYIQAELNTGYYDKHINYYIAINNKEFTNCNMRPSEFTDKEFYLVLTRDANGVISYDTNQSGYDRYMIEGISSNYNQTDAITFCTSIKDSYVDKCRDIWTRQREDVIGMISKVSVLLGFAFVCFIYLVWATGKDKEGKPKRGWLDSAWTEVHIVVIGFTALASIGLSLVMADEYMADNFVLPLFRTFGAGLTAIGSLVLLIFLLSLVRKIKCKKCIEESITCKGFKWGKKRFVNAIKGIGTGIKNIWSNIVRLLSKKTGVLLVSMLLVYTAIIGICGIFTPESPIPFFLAIWFFCFASIVLAYRAKDMDEIKKGTDAIRNGNLSYKIADIKSEDMKLLAENINEIGQGLENSVSDKLKAERLKTDLITNVSHDLKTPLTSIISYTELLSKVDGLPEEAGDYIQVIAKKSARLKNLTQDLFDISKVQSGNETIHLERLDVALLINQSLAERDSEIMNSGCPFCVKTEKELHIMADGRKMSRVIANLIDNILKYAMTGTRVFIMTYEKDDKVIIEMKNTSSYPMEFDAEEITGRFVRGDESRTDGGNGLGLAIAQSYTTACNGTFEVAVDGDLFKIIMSFNKTTQ